MLKIGVCGAHGSGKTTLAKLLFEKFELPFLADTMRQMWRDFGVEDFEKLPKTVRSYFQKEAILKQINREETEGKNGFITDRTVMDNWGYTKISGNFDEIDLKIYETIVRKHLSSYSHFIYLPISKSFKAEQEKLRANLATQNTFAQIVESALIWVEKEKLLIVENEDLQKRVSEVGLFLKS